MWKWRNHDYSQQAPKSHGQSDSSNDNPKIQDDELMIQAANYKDNGILTWIAGTNITSVVEHTQPQRPAPVDPE